MRKEKSKTMSFSSWLVRRLLEILPLTPPLSVKPSNDRELTTSRLIKASPERIYQAISSPELLAQWWGPKDFRNTFHEFEFKPGGVWRFDMHGPDGTDYPNKCVFDVTDPQRIVIHHVETMHDFLLTITLSWEIHGTRLDWCQAFQTAEECDRVRPYAPQCNEENLDRLEAVLAAMPADNRTLVLNRVIDVSPEKLYRCWTTPELVKQWFTPRPWQTVMADLDVRAGGSSNIVMRSPEGEEFPNRGIYLEVVPNERLVFTDAYTKAWEPSGKPFMTGIITFEDLGNGKTNYTATVHHWTAEDCEKHRAMGFHDGWGAATDQLVEVASKL
jgi:uncharacterized protein YndB with AHSA1/START domain